MRDRKMKGQPLIPVLAAVISRNERHLICQRPMHKRHGGYWEFPGGKLELGESWHDAAVRELREELDLEVIGVDKPLLRVRDPGSEFEIVFVRVEVRGEPRPLEHTALNWARTEELLKLNLAPSDRRFVEWLLEGSRRP